MVWMEQGLIERTCNTDRRVIGTQTQEGNEAMETTTDKNNEHTVMRVQLIASVGSRSASTEKHDQELGE